MLIRWPGIGELEHMVDYDVHHKDITLVIHQVGSDDYGDMRDPKVLKVCHQVDKTGHVSLEVFVDTTRSVVKN